MAAVIESWFRQDLQKPVQVHYLDGSLFSNNGNGNRIGVELTNGGEDYTVTGTVSGYAVLADGSTVPCTGAKSGNKASILVPPAAYLPGNIFISIFLTDGTTVTTLAAVSSTVIQARTDNQVSPGSVVTDWTNTINAAMQSVETAAANLGKIVATPYAQLTFPVPLGKYTYYNNNLYRCTTPIESSEDFTAAHWSSALNLGNEVSDLKSALLFNTKYISGNIDRVVYGTEFKSNIGYFYNTSTHEISNNSDSKWMVIRFPVFKGDIFKQVVSSGAITISAMTYVVGDTYSQISTIYDSSIRAYKVTDDGYIIGNAYNANSWTDARLLFLHFDFVSTILEKTDEQLNSKELTLDDVKDGIGCYYTFSGSTATKNTGASNEYIAVWLRIKSWQGLSVPAFGGAYTVTLKYSDGEEAYTAISNFFNADLGYYVFPSDGIICGHIYGYQKNWNNIDRTAYKFNYFSMIKVLSDTDNANFADLHAVVDDTEFTLKDVNAGIGYYYTYSGSTATKTSAGSDSFVAIHFDIKKDQHLYVPVNMRKSGGTYSAQLKFFDGSTFTNVSTYFNEWAETYDFPSDGEIYGQAYRIAAWTESALENIEMAFYGKPGENKRSIEYISDKTIKNLKIVHVGTSIPEGATYPQYAANAIGSKVYNNSIGSSRLTIPASSQYGLGKYLIPTISEIEAACEAAGITDPDTIQMYKNNSYETVIMPYIDGTIDTCDVLVFDHGYNDSYGLVTSYSLSTTDSDINWDSEDKTDFFGAFNLLYKQILAVKPDLRIVVVGYLENHSNNSANNWNSLTEVGAVVCHCQQLLAEHYGFTIFKTWEHTGWRKDVFVPNTSTYIADINTEKGTSYYQYNADTDHNVSIFQYFMPDGVHPHSDVNAAVPGMANKRLNEIFANFYRSTL